MSAGRATIDRLRLGAGNCGRTRGVVDSGTTSGAGRGVLRAGVRGWPGITVTHGKVRPGPRSPSPLSGRIGGGTAGERVGNPPRLRQGRAYPGGRITPIKRPTPHPAGGSVSRPGRQGAGRHVHRRGGPGGQHGPASIGRPASSACVSTSESPAEHPTPGGGNLTCWRFSLPAIAPTAAEDAKALCRLKKRPCCFLQNPESWDLLAGMLRG